MVPRYLAMGMHRRVPSVALNNPCGPLSAVCQLPEAAADHRGVGGPARPGHPGPGRAGPTPEGGTLRARQLCRAAAETGTHTYTQRNSLDPPPTRQSDVVFEGCSPCHGADHVELVMVPTMLSLSWCRPR